MKKLTFSVNQCNHKGDVFDECILIHINDDCILRFNDITEYDKFILDLSKMRKEMGENIKE